MFSWFKTRKLKREWRLVATLEATIQWSDKKGNPTGAQDTVFYYLYESGVGERKCEYRGTGELAVENYRHLTEWANRTMESHIFYLKKIVPWLNGAYDPQIPSFETIKAKDFKDALRGSK